MAIYRLLQNKALGPDELNTMTAAYEATLRALGLVDRSDPITDIIARKIVEIAQTGERDPIVIRARTISELGAAPFSADSAP